MVKLLDAVGDVDKKMPAGEEDGGRGIGSEEDGGVADLRETLKVQCNNYSAGMKPPSKI